MSTIELGEVSSAPGDEVRLPEFDRRVVFRVAAVVALLGCLFGMTASARPGPYAVHPLWKVPVTENDGATLGPAAVYITRAGDDAPRISAYELASGAVQWTTKLDDALGYAQLDDDDHLLLLPTDFQNGVGFRIARATVALDARTGTRLWSAPGEPMVLSAGDALMADYTDNGGYAQLRLIRLDDRSTVWAHETPGVVSVAFALVGNRPDRFVTVTTDGRAEVRRLADGSLVAAARIPWVKADPEQGWFNDLAASSDHLMVNSNRNGHADLSVYRLDTLDRVWQADGTDGYAFPCGTGICVDNVSGLTAYDAPTGRMRWRLDGIGNGWAASDNRVVVSDLGDTGQQFLVDAATGARVGPPGPGETVWTTEPGQALLVLRPTVSPPGRTSVTRWDLATGRRDLLGAIDWTSVNRCQARDRFLGCYQGNEYAVTAVGR